MGAWNVPSLSMCQESGRSSQISTYSFPMILFTSLGGTGRLATNGSPIVGAAPAVDTDKEAGHVIAETGGDPPDGADGPNQDVTVELPAVGIEKIGREPTVERGEYASSQLRMPGATARSGCPRDCLGVPCRGTPPPEHPGAPEYIGRSSIPVLR